MCGIVAAVSSRNVVPILVQGLARLEYRGYDSCGVAVYVQGPGADASGLRRARSTSRVAELVSQLEGAAAGGTDRLEGFLGIAHTRWGDPRRALGGQRAPPL